MMSTIATVPATNEDMTKVRSFGNPLGIQSGLTLAPSGCRGE